MIVHSEVPASTPSPSPADASSPVRAAGEAPTFKAGDDVRIGRGTTVWQLEQLWTSTNGIPLASLRSGWNSTTVCADRLVRA